MDRREFLYSSVFAAATSPSFASQRSSSNSEAAPSGSKGRQLAYLEGTPGSLTVESFSKLLQSIAPLTADKSLTTLPDILKPIDTGAESLLEQHKNAALIYSPFEITYLAASLDAFISNCLVIREKAQQLEVLAAAQRLDLLIEGSTIDFMTSMSQLSFDNDRHIAGELFQPVLQDGRARSTENESSNAYWKNRLETVALNISARKEAYEARKFQLGLDGSGNNHPQRFKALKRQFETELTEAYLRARSLAVGMKAVLGVELPLPPVIDTGYLDELADWARKAFYRLDRIELRSTVSTLMIPLRKGKEPVSSAAPLADADFLSQRAAGNFVFSLSPAYFNNQQVTFKEPRLIGLEAAVWTDANPKVLDYVRLKVELPEQSVAVDGNTLWSSRPLTNLSVVTFPQGPEINFTSRREVLNANPVGEWKIALDKRSVTDKDSNRDELVQNVILVMRLKSSI